MHFTTQTLLSALALVTPGLAGYTLEDDYSASSFFDMFDFFTDADPTNGFVQYVDQGTASSDGLISTNSSSIYMGVDSTNVASSAGRTSVRLTSKKSYDSGLVILDLSHMPGGICGTWPAFWMVGPDWPTEGEIDIIEGVNDQSTNAMTLHTGPGCSITDNGAFSGSMSTDNCDVNAAGQAENAGCSIDDSDTTSYGTGFNSNQGGVFATEVTSEAISIYFFPRGSVPSDISSGSPDPSTWGKPRAQFQGGCDISSSFKSQQIVFDTTFCGDWAGEVWSSGSCASKADTCNDFVANNPSAFADAYWSVNSLQVFQNDGSAASSAPAVSTPIAVSTPVAVSTPYAVSTPAPSTFATSAVPIASSPVSLPSSFPTLTPSGSGLGPFSSGSGSGFPYPSGTGTGVFPSSGFPTAPTGIVTQYTTALYTTFVTQPGPTVVMTVTADVSVTQVAVVSSAPATPVTETALPASFFPGSNHQGGIPTNWKRAPDSESVEAFKNRRRSHRAHFAGHRRRVAQGHAHGPHA